MSRDKISWCFYDDLEVAKAIATIYPKQQELIRDFVRQQENNQCISLFQFTRLILSLVDSGIKSDDILSFISVNEDAFDSDIARWFNA